MQTTRDFQKGRIKITKLEAARRQLETSITLYFTGGDPVSTHTLASAAAEILKGLNDAVKGSPMLLDLEASKVIPHDKLKLARKVFRNPQNFFKHADEDPEGVLDFHPEIPSGFIIAGLEKYREISGENPPIMRVFALWFRTHWADLYQFSNGEDAVLEMTKIIFKFEDKAKFFAHFLPLYEAEAIKPSSRQGHSRT